MGQGIEACGTAADVVGKPLPHREDDDPNAAANQGINFSNGFNGWLSGAQALLPEPLLGDRVYENFAWFAGPMTATDLATPGSSGPGGTWTANATPSDLSLGSGNPIVWEANVTSGVPIAKVQRPRQLAVVAIPIDATP